MSCTVQKETASSVERVTIQMDVTDGESTQAADDDAVQANNYAISTQTDSAAMAEIGHCLNAILRALSGEDGSLYFTALIIMSLYVLVQTHILIALLIIHYKFRKYWQMSDKKICQIIVLGVGVVYCTCCLVEQFCYQVASSSILNGLFSFL